jgi:hypothetical protein
MNPLASRRVHQLADFRTVAPSNIDHYNPRFPKSP